MKQLQVVNLATSSLVQVEKDVSSDIQVLYKGAPVANLSLVQIQIENNGNQPVLEQDYAQAFVIKFPLDTKIVASPTIDSYPPNLGMTTQIMTNTAQLSSVLLNPGDRVVLGFLVTNIPPDRIQQPFDVEVRIAGIPNIPVVNAIDISNTSSRFPSFLGVIGLVFSIVSVIFSYFQKSQFSQKYAENRVENRVNDELFRRSEESHQMLLETIAKIQLQADEQEGSLDRDRITSKRGESISDVPTSTPPEKSQANSRPYRD